MLTETLDSIPVDEDGLPSFEALADGDVTNASDRSCPSSPDGSPRTPEPEEPSLVRATASCLFSSSNHHLSWVITYVTPMVRPPMLRMLLLFLPVHGRHQIRFWASKVPICLSHLAVPNPNCAAFAALWSLYIVRDLERVQP